MNNEGCCSGHDHEHNQGACTGHDHNHNEGCCGHGGHHHQDHDGCGCGGHEHSLIHLTLEDGSQVDANVLEIFEVGDRSYIALLPLEEEKVLLYRFEESEEGVELANIETDEEFEEVSKALYDLLEIDEEWEEE